LGIKSREKVIVGQLYVVFVVPQEISWCSDVVNIFMTLHFFKKSRSWGIITVYDTRWKVTVRSPFVMTVVPKMHGNIFQRHGSEIRVFRPVHLRIKTERHWNGPGPTFTPTVSFEMLDGGGVG
jgi:hypothetical protein